MTKARTTIVTEASSSAPQLPSRELVGIFSQAQPLLDCIKALQTKGFSHQQLSILSSHEAIEAAAEDGGTWQDRLMPLLSETRYEVPLVSGLLIALAGGPAAAVVGGLAAAGVGVMAIKDLLEQTIALPNSEAFAEAVRTGEILLWVAVPDQASEQAAHALLESHGARNIHLTERG
jgi:hypothetical protein